jgi:hypothetical protein
MLANPEPESGEDSDSIEQFDGSDSASDYSVPDADATSLVEEPRSDAEFFEQPVKKGKGKQKLPVKGDTRALILTKRESANLKPKTGTDDQRSVTMGDSTLDDVTAPLVASTGTSKRKRAPSKSV